MEEERLVQSSVSGLSLLFLQCPAIFKFRCMVFFKRRCVFLNYCLPRSLRLQKTRLQSEPRLDIPSERPWLLRLESSIRRTQSSSSSCLTCRSRACHISIPSTYAVTRPQTYVRYLMLCKLSSCSFCCVVPRYRLLPRGGK